jgi:hypothetical protein
MHLQWGGSLRHAARVDVSSIRLEIASIQA